MYQSLTFIKYERDQHLYQQIQSRISKIKESLTQLITEAALRNIKTYYSRSDLQELEDTLIDMRKQGYIIDAYRKECEQIARLYAQHILSAQLMQNPPTRMAIQNYFQQLKATEFFNYPSIFLQVSNRLLAQNFYGNHDFILMSKQDKVDDNCVGCNSWLYKFHMIENIFNYKQIPTYFLYNNSEEYTALKKQKLLKAPPHELVIDLKDFTSYEEILLNKILYILKNEGGHLLIGCQKMQHLMKNKILLDQAFVQNPQLNQIHFVIGQILSEEQKKQLQDRIQKLIQRISPMVSLNQQIQIRYLRVIKSQYHHSVELSKIYGQHVEGRYVILIVIKPKSHKYSLKPFSNVNLLQQSAQQMPRPNQRFSAFEVKEPQLQSYLDIYSQQQNNNQSTSSDYKQKQILDDWGRDIQNMTKKQFAICTHNCQFSQK